MLCHCPNAQLSEELSQGIRQVVGIEATGVGKNPSVAATEKGLLQADAGVFDTRDNAVGVNADKGDDGRAPTFDFSLKAPAARAKFVIAKLIGTSGGPLDDVCDAKLKVKKQGCFKRGEKPRGESAAVKGGPEAIARAAEVVADGRGVQAGVDTREKDDEVFGREIRNELVARREDLGFAGFPGSDQFPMHWAAYFRAIASKRG